MKRLIKTSLDRVLGDVPFRILKRLSLFRAIPEEEQRRVIMHCALFSGDIPVVHKSPAVGRVARRGISVCKDGSASTPANFVCAEDYCVPRAIREFHENITYGPDGVAWSRGGVEERLSVHVINGAWPFLRHPLLSRADRIEKATIIQSEHPATYGDWVSEQVKTLALAGEVLEPVVLPGFLGRRPYVQHEMKRLGIDFIAIDKPVRISKACVVFKPRPFTYWNREDVAAYRRAFGIRPPTPFSNSILYLSRAGVESEQLSAVRRDRSRTIAAVVREMGGRVVDTAPMNFDDFSALAEQAETVVADHGAAMFNILQWNTRYIVESVTDSWWSDCFVFLGVACDVENHAIVRCDMKSDDELKERIRTHIEEFRRDVSPPRSAGCSWSS